jgi:superfamily II DNA or RNA helicase
MQLATGGGKTVVVAAIVAEAVAAGGRVLFIAHRRELIQQASAKLHAAGVDHGIIQAGFPTRPGERVQVASISTIYARAIRSSIMELPPADLVVVDEAHHAAARTYRKLIGAYPRSIILGMTATPCRGDGLGLGDIFEELIEGPPVADLTADGFLLPVRVYAPTQPDLTGVRIQAGEYAETELAERMNTGKLVADIVSTWLKKGRSRPTVSDTALSSTSRPRRTCPR